MANYIDALEKTAQDNVAAAQSNYNIAYDAAFAAACEKDEAFSELIRARAKLRELQEES